MGAEVALRRVLDGGHPVSLVAARMGEAELLLGDLAKAHEWLDSGTFAVGEQAHGYRMTGLLAMREGRLPDAGNAFDKALAITPEDASLWVDIGRLRYLGGEQVAAIVASERAVLYGPSNAAALQVRGQLLRNSAGLFAALPWFASALRRRPENMDLLADQAATLGEMGRASEMLAVTRAMIMLDDADPRPFYLQAVIAARVGDFALARTLFYRTGSAFRDVPAAILLQGVLELQAGNAALASELFGRLRRLQPDNARAAELLAKALSQAGEYRDVIAQFGPAAVRPGTSPYLQTLVARAYEALGLRERAARYLDLAAASFERGSLPIEEDMSIGVAQSRWRADPTNISAAVSLTRALIEAGQTDAASEVAQDFLRRRPGAYAARRMAGDAAFAQHDYPAALRYYQVAGQIRTSFGLLQRLTTAERLLGRRDGADARLSAWSDQHPADGRPLLLLAESAFERGQFDTGFVLTKLARKMDVGGNDPVVLARQSKAALATGNIEAAVVEGQRAYSLQRANGAAVLAYGRALKAAGKNEQANILLAKAEKLAGR